MTTERLFDDERRGLTIGVVLSVSLIAFEAMSVATILPVTARELEGLGGYGWAFSAFMLANLVGTIATGQLADEKGPVRPLILALFFFATGLAVAGFASSWPLLILGRALQGAGGGGIMTLAYLSIRRGYPERLRARMLAIVSSAWVLPSLLGPLAAGLVAQHLSWRLAFLGLLPLVLLTGALMMPALARMPRNAGEAADRGRLLFALALAIGTGLVLFGLELRGIPAAICVAIGLGFAIPSMTKLLPSGIWRAATGLAAGLGFRGLLSFVFFGAEAFVPLGLSTLRGLSPTEGGLVLTGASLSWVVGSWTQARLDARHGAAGRRTRLITGLALVVFGIVSMAVAAILPFVPVTFSAVGWALGGLGMGLAYPTSSVLVLGLAEAGQEGRTSANLNLIESLGIAFGAGLAGAAFDLGRQAGFGDTKTLALTFGVAVAPAMLAFVAAVRATRG